MDMRRSFFPCAVLLGVLTSIASAAETDPPKYLEAVRLSDARKRKEAEEALAQAVAADLDEAKALHQKGQFAEALARLRRAINYDLKIRPQAPPPIPLHRQYHETMIALGRRAEARDAYDKLLKSPALAPDARAAYSYLRARLADTVDKRIQELEKTALDHKDLFWPHYELAGLYAERSADAALPRNDKDAFLSRAIDAASRAAELEKNDADVQNVLGDLLYQQAVVCAWDKKADRSRDFLARAQKALAAALAVDPKHAQAHYNLGVTHDFSGNFEKAEAEFREALKLAPGWPEALQNLGHALSRAGKYDYAIAQFDQAVAKKPAYGLAWNNLAVALWRRGRDSEKSAADRTGVDREKSLAAAMTDYHRAHAAIAKAEAAGQTVIESFKHSVDRSIGDVEIARASDALAAHPDDAERHIALGRAYAEHDWRDEAAKVIRAALIKFPQNAALHAALGDALAEGRKQVSQETRTAAVAAYRKSIELDPTRPETRIRLARLLEADRAYDDAVASLEKAVALLAARVTDAPAGDKAAAARAQGEAECDLAACLFRRSASAKEPAGDLKRASELLSAAQVRGAVPPPGLREAIAKGTAFKEK
jgi:tetratricopeptide (TPR) repeat protein